jgi:orotate phosphoribosyltransferase-like protein
MPGGRGKKIHVDPADVERLARKGHQQNDIASQLNISVDTYYERIKENSDIAEAYKKGREAFLEYIRKTRAERVLEALDELIMQRHPAAVIFASKTILGLQETVTHNHTANGNPIANDERLKELEAKRRMLMQSTEIVIDAKKDDE